jgi:hypothetical protein
MKDKDRNVLRNTEGLEKLVLMMYYNKRKYFDTNRFLSIGIPLLALHNP